MSFSDMFWKAFEETGSVTAYLLYKDYEKLAVTCQSADVPQENLLECTVSS